MIKFKADLKENIHKKIGEKYPIDQSELDIDTTPSIKMG
ncbi:unnamed protein product, partial [marine sediment metagenome]